MPSCRIFRYKFDRCEPQPVGGIGHVAAASFDRPVDVYDLKLFCPFTERPRDSSLA